MHEQDEPEDDDDADFPAWSSHHARSYTPRAKPPRLLPCTIGLTAEQIARLKKLAATRMPSQATEWRRPTYATLIREAIEKAFPASAKPAAAKKSSKKSSKKGSK